jgi:hypothetical protein
MDLINRQQRRAEHARADSKQTELCTYLSAILLCGLLLNALFTWGLIPLRLL